MPNCTGCSECPTCGFPVSQNLHSCPWCSQKQVATSQLTNALSAEVVALGLFIVLASAFILKRKKQ